MKTLRAATLALTVLSTPAMAFEMPADEAAAQFVTSNVISTFYHELGHALIDVLQLPVLGKEEDAADTLASVLTHAIWEEDAATQITYDTANAFALWASEPEGWDSAYADTHSLDQQRYFSTVCLFYGANPEAREAVAKDLELPSERAELCPDEFAQAEAGWGAMLEGLEPGADTKGLVLVETDDADPIGQILAAEIADLNKTYGLPQEVQVSVEICGEANAFYLPGEYRIVLCREYAEEMAALWAQVE